MLSSARSTRRGGPAAAGRDWVAAEVASVVDPVPSIANRPTSLKTLPAPGTLSTPTQAPIRSASCLQMARPSPVPPKRRVIDPSAWEKGWKMAGMRPGSMPIPVSRTVKSNSATPGRVSLPVTCRETVPCSVKRTAFARRLFRICPRRQGSPTSRSGVAGSTFTS